MGGITKIISFGKFNFKYFIMILSATVLLFIGKGGYPLYTRTENTDNTEVKIDAHKLLKTFLKYIGFSFCVIGEIIRRKISFKNGEDRNLIKNDVRYTASQKAEISKHLIGPKDIIYIIIIAIAHLGDEFLAITIKANSKQNLIKMDELYNTIEFIFLYLTSYFIFKLRYYKHQKISIFIIIFCEILRIIIRTFSNEQNFLSHLFGTLLQILRAFIDSLFIGYSKALMEYKYFSPYKALYIFGFINGLIILIMYFIFSFIPYQKSTNFFAQEYKKQYYFDNFFSIFEGFTFVKFIGLFLNMIGVAGSQLLFNFIVNDFTMCHIFIYYQVYVLYENINKKENNLVFIIITSIIEIIVTLIFLEIIILHCFGLDKNIKINIEERAFLDVNSRFEKNDSYDMNAEYDVHCENNDKNSENVSDSLKSIPLMPLNNTEEQ
jgi:hypothetical protein